MSGAPIHVVEFGTYWAAPLVGRYLRGFGYHVTAVLRPDDANGVSEERDCMGPRVLDALRRGKDCVTLDLRTAAHRQQALVATADVVVENFAPNVLDRLGLGYDACVAYKSQAYKSQAYKSQAYSAHRPRRLIYASLPGFAPGDQSDQSNQSSSSCKAYESILLAAGGIFRVVKGRRDGKWKGAAPPINTRGRVAFYYPVQ